MKFIVKGITYYYYPMYIPHNFVFLCKYRLRSGYSWTSYVLVYGICKSFENKMDISEQFDNYYAKILNSPSYTSTRYFNHYFRPINMNFALLLGRLLL